MPRERERERESLTMNDGELKGGAAIMKDANDYILCSLSTQRDEQT